MKTLRPESRARSRAQVDQLTTELTRTRATLARKTQALVEQRQLNCQLMRRIRELEREIERGNVLVERDSHNSSLPPSLDPPWQKVRRTRSLRKRSGIKAGGQTGHPGRTLKQIAQPDEIILHAPAACRNCGKSLKRVRATGCVRRQVLDIREGRMQVTEHRALLICCTHCEATTQGEFPTDIRAPVQYGPAVLSRASYLHLYQLLPSNRTSETMRDLFGCTISPATIQRASRLFSGKLVRCEQRIKAAIGDSSVVGADGTGLRVAGSNNWIHVARTNQCTHFA